MGEMRTFEVGPVTFKVDRDRTVDSEDHGPTIVILVGDVDGKEALRFDCFVRNPHYHYIAPDGRGERYPIDKVLAGADLIVWAMDQIDNSLSGMLDHAGYPEVASILDGDEEKRRVANIVWEIEKFLKAEEEPPST